MRPRIKVLIFLAVWKRPEITELCFLGIERLKQHPDYEIQALAVISEEEMIPLCEKYGVAWTMHENIPVSRKKNHGLSVAQGMDFDYLLEIGSDDLIMSELLDHYRQFVWKHDFFGLKDVAYIDTESGSCRRLQSKSTYGAGRMISRRALEKMKFKLWADNISRGMDNNSLFRMAYAGILYKQVDPIEVPGVVDVKSEVNIWPFNHLIGREYDINLILDRLSQAERDKLECLLQRSIPANSTEG